MGSKLNIVGANFGRLTVVEETTMRQQRAIVWRCLCDCGNETLVSTGRLRSGHTQSCGCKKVDGPHPSQKTHGHSFVDGKATSEYNAWSSMKSRCLNPKAPNYKDYGGRGITVCERWLDSFENFLADMGPKPSPEHSLDRYPDNDGNYEPGNCRWADGVQQSSNKRSNHLVMVDGEAMTVTEAARRKGANIVLVRSRIKRGWSIERALS